MKDRRATVAAADRPLERTISRVVAAFRARRPLRGTSLIVTIFGDALSPHGSSIWLSDLIALLEPFGLDSRLTRTSVFRLVRQGLLTARRVGRRSYYTLSDTGKTVFDEATQRIYAGRAQQWNGIWTWLVFPGSVKSASRRELEWHGFAPLSRGIWAHPHADDPTLEAVRRELSSQPFIVLRSAPESSKGSKSLRELVAGAWNFPKLEAGYVSFVRHFQPVATALEAAPGIAPALAFRVRTLLVHDYRRLLLRDPQLPGELLPAGWMGRAAFDLCRSLYAAVLVPSEEYLTATVSGISGPLPAADAALKIRFGGLAISRTRSKG